MTKRIVRAIAEFNGGIQVKPKLAEYQRKTGTPKSCDTAIKVKPIKYPNKKHDAN